MEKLIKKAHDKITRTKGREYAPTALEIENEINKSLTAVEWLIHQLNTRQKPLDNSQIDELFEQAKEMEKDNMHKCASFWRGKENEIEKPIFEIYYNETFNK
jgi:hypothetical protein